MLQRVVVRRDLYAKLSCAVPTSRTSSKDNAYPAEVAVVVKAGEAIVGKERAAVKTVTMGAEDFSYFLHERPGCK